MRSNTDCNNLLPIPYPFLLLFLVSLFCYSQISAEYVRPTYIGEEVWNQLSPYFLPEELPEKTILDEVFSKRQVLKSLKSMRKSGFFIITNPKDKIIVAKHIQIKKYLIKVYLDTMPVHEWDCWFRRARGARIIQNAIIQHGYQAIMKVPKKWVYPLPSSPSRNAESKNFVLVVEEMDILSDEKNRSAYKKKMTPYILDALYTMLTENQLIDSIYADNTSFCKDGKLAFIDTEWTGSTDQNVPLAIVGHYLSKEMLAYWEHLLINGL